MTQEQQLEAPRLAQHTPGPWFIDTAITADLEDHVCISAKLHGMLAQVVWRMEGAERTPTCEANARLIAEAPEMLKALRAIAAITTRADQDPEAMCAEIQGICRVALAKATGGAA